MNRIRIVLGAACLAFAATIVYGVLWSAAAAQGANVPGTPPLLTATPPVIAVPQPAANTAAIAGASYVGSRACQRCHAAIYERWSHTRMANIITDPKVNPRAVLGDFKTPNPLVTFKLEDVAFVYGRNGSSSLNASSA
jgi:cytochrome c553